MVKMALFGKNDRELAKAKREIISLIADIAEIEIKIEAFADITIMEKCFFSFDMILIADALFYSVLPRLQAFTKNDSIMKRKGQRILLSNFKMPIDIVQMNTWLENIIEHNIDFSIPIPGGHKTERANDIIYFENKDRKIYVKTKNDYYLSSLSLQKAKDLVAGHDFVVPYVSFIINLHWVESIKGRDIILKNKETVPLSQKKAAQIRKGFRAFLSKLQ